MDLHQLFLIFAQLSSIREKGSIDVSSHYDKQKMAVVVKIAEDGEEGAGWRGRTALCEKRQRKSTELDRCVPLLDGKKITLDYDNLGNENGRSDGRQVRMVTLPCIVS